MSVEFLLNRDINNYFTELPESLHNGFRIGQDAEVKRGNAVILNILSINLVYVLTRTNPSD